MQCIVRYVRKNQLKKPVGFNIGFMNPLDESICSISVCDRGIDEPIRQLIEPVRGIHKLDELKVMCGRSPIFRHVGVNLMGLFDLLPLSNGIRMESNGMGFATVFRFINCFK